MAGTLTVQNLQGPSSGANANKIIVPSGQTLDVSGGTLTPAVNQIVQMVTSSTVSGTTTSGTSYVSTSLAVSITPKFSNSLIQLYVNSSSWWNTSTASGNYIYTTLYRNSTNIGIGANSSLTLKGAYGDSQNYAQPFSFSAQDEPSTTSSVTYTMYMKLLSGGTTAGLNDDRMENTITAVEIKQ